MVVAHVNQARLRAADGPVRTIYWYPAASQERVTKAAESRETATISKSAGVCDESLPRGPCMIETESQQNKRNSASVSDSTQSCQARIAAVLVAEYKVR